MRDTQQIVNKAWSFAHVLRDDGLSYMAYTEQITFLLFLKMAHEQTQPPWNRPGIVPAGLDWPSLLARDGEDLESHYRHILQELGKTLLEIHGRCGIVVPDNVLFEGGAGETVRRNLLQQFDVHTLLRLPTGIFYAQGVKANVLFFDAKPAREQPWTEALWVYDLRTNKHFTLKQNTLERSDLDEFVECFRPGFRQDREETWSEQNPEGRWRRFGYDEIARRDKLNLDIFWLKDESLRDAEDLPDPDVISREIVEDLQAALEEFQAIAAELED